MGSRAGAPPFRLRIAARSEYGRAAAVVATSPTHRVGVTAVALFSGRTIKAFKDPEEAKEWLVQYASAGEPAAVRERR